MLLDLYVLRRGATLRLFRLLLAAGLCVLAGLLAAGLCILTQDGILLGDVSFLM